MATKYLVSGKDGDHLPVSGPDGKLDHRHMGAAWAALHGGYRGNKYEGAGKAEAIAKLKAHYKAEGLDIPSECSRVFVAGGIELREGAFDPTKGTLTVRVIQPGMNSSKSRFYPAEVLKRDHAIFNGQKMFADHQTEAQAKAQPEGSVNNWVGQLTRVWPENDGTIMGEAQIIDPSFKAKLSALAEKGLLKEMGISIRAVGEATTKEVEGVETRYVESLLSARSVDFVTYPGAGGRVLAIESEEGNNDVDVISEAEFRTRRPDIVAAIKLELQETIRMTAEEKKQLDDALAAVATLTAANTAMTEAAKAEKIKADEAAKTAKVATAAATLTTMLTESKLPEIAVKRIKKQFEGAEDDKGFKEAIAEEADYIKSITPVKRHNGADDNAELTEVEKAKAKTDFDSCVESFVAMGFTKEEAEIAAKGKK